MLGMIAQDTDHFQKKKNKRKMKSQAQDLNTHQSEEVDQHESGDSMLKR